MLIDSLHACPLLQARCRQRGDRLRDRALHVFRSARGQSWRRQAFVGSYLPSQLHTQNTHACSQGWGRALQCGRTCPTGFIGCGRLQVDARRGCDKVAGCGSRRRAAQCWRARSAISRRASDTAADTVAQPKRRAQQCLRSRRTAAARPTADVVQPHAGARSSTFCLRAHDDAREEFN